MYSIPIISGNGSLSMRATVTAWARNSSPCHIPPSQLQQHWLVKHHGIFFSKITKNMCKYQLNENIQFNSSHKIVVIGKFTWQHSHRPIHPSQLGDHHQSHDLLHQDRAQTAAQE